MNSNKNFVIIGINAKSINGDDYITDYWTLESFFNLLYRNHKQREFSQ